MVSGGMRLGAVRQVRWFGVLFGRGKLRPGRQVRLGTER